MIVTEGISLERGDFGLSHISLIAPKGSYTVLMGPSGAGKTLLLETIAGIYRVREGTIAVGGKDVTMVPPESRSVGFVYQDYSLFPHLSVGENVSYGLRMAGIPAQKRKEIVQALLSRFAILPLADRYPGTLSGGEKQRVALARALAIRPTVLLLDEPFAALDPDTRASCMEEVRAIQREHNLTILQVSHARDEAYLLADQVVIIEGGVIVQAGSPVYVFSHPVNRTVATLAGFENILEGIAGPSVDGKTVVAIGKGSLVAIGRFHEGEKCLACFRAGDIMLTGPPNPERNHSTRIEGTVISLATTDLGYRLQVDGPFPLTIDVPRQLIPTPEYRPGDLVTAWIAPENVHLIPLCGVNVEEIEHHEG
jgi:molybdate/tungstate transport system ATP-binding protein